VNHEHGTFAGPTNAVFANFHAEIAHSTISRAFGLPRHELMVTNGVLWNAAARFVPVSQRDLSGRLKESANPTFMLRHELFGYPVDSPSILSGSIFHGVRLLCVLQVNRISCSCGIPCGASRETERERERETKSQPQDQLQACSN